jgi:hypothetical protein
MCPELAPSLRRVSFGVTVGLEGGAENVGLAGDDRTHDNRGRETGRNYRIEECRRDRCSKRVRAAAMVEAGGVSPSCIVNSGRNGTMLTVLHSGADGCYRRHNMLGPPGERRRTFGSERVDAALNAGEPAVNIAQQNAGGVWDN